MEVARRVRLDLLPRGQDSKSVLNLECGRSTLPHGARPGGSLLPCQPRRLELDEPSLNLPLDNLPHLYELWGTLQVIDVPLGEARNLGYDSIEHRLARQMWCLRQGSSLTGLRR